MPVVVVGIIEVAGKLRAIRKRPKVRLRAVSRPRVLDQIVPPSAEERPNQPVGTVDGASPQCRLDNLIIFTSYYASYASLWGRITPDDSRI